MTHYVYDGISKATFFFGGDGIFAIAVALSVALFILGIKLKNRDKKKKSFYIFFGVGFGIFAFETLCFVSVEFAPVSACIFYLLITLFSLIIFGYILFIKKPKKGNDVKKEFIKLIDEKLSESKKNVQTPFIGYDTDNGEVLPERENFSEEKTPNGIETKVKTDIDYEHVKNVIERVKYFSLSPADRHTVKELENAVKLSESGNSDSDTAEKLNDGLGALLKIMAKYKI